MNSNGEGGAGNSNSKAQKPSLVISKSTSPILSNSPSNEDTALLAASASKSPKTTRAVLFSTTNGSDMGGQDITNQATSTSLLGDTASASISVNTTATLLQAPPKPSATKKGILRSPSKFQANLGDGDALSSPLATPTAVIATPDSNPPPQKPPYRTQRQMSVAYRKKLETFDHLLVFTKPHAPPKLVQTLTSFRFWLRLAQCIGAVLSFATVLTAVLRISVSLYILENSGVQFILFVSIPSFFVSASEIFLYQFPQFFGIPPHRHERTGPIELGLDIIYALLWIACCIYVGTRNRFCQTVGMSDPLFPMDGVCQTTLWIFSTAFCGATGLLFLLQFALGIKDTTKSKVTEVKPSNIMFARGGWIGLTPV